MFLLCDQSVPSRRTNQMEKPCRNISVAIGEAQASDRSAVRLVVGIGWCENEMWRRQLLPTAPHGLVGYRLGLADGVEPDVFGGDVLAVDGGV